MSLAPLQFRGDLAAKWTKYNPVLKDREIGFELDTKKYKIGDGKTKWSGLDYWYGTAIESDIVDATEQTVIADANLIPIVETTTLKKTLWSTIKSTLKTYFDGLYLALTGGTITGNVVINGTLGVELAPALTGNSGDVGKWTLSNTTGYVQPFAGSILKTGDGTGTITPTDATTIVAGTTYKIVIVVASISGSTAYISLGSQIVAPLTAAITYTFYVTAVSTGKLVITPQATALRINISSISIKAVTSNTGNLENEGNLILKNVVKTPQGVDIFRILPTGGVVLTGIIGTGAVGPTTELNSVDNGAYGVRTSGPIKAKNFYLQNTNQGFYTYQGVPMFYANASGLYGMNTTVPAKQLEINNATGQCLRLTYNDANGSATYYADFNVSSAGLLTINASGGIINTANDIEITDTTKGIILKSPDGSRWRVTVDNSGNLITTSI